MSDATRRLRIVYFGSGAFGLPTLAKLVQAHDVALVVSQPDRPAGRNRHVTPTPVSAFAQSRGLALFRPENLSLHDDRARILALKPDALVVIAYGHKLLPELTQQQLAINLHASLLPKFRGAAPINWAMISGDSVTGVSVITLAQRMDAGDILAQVSTPIDPLETAAELHDRLAMLGAPAVLDVLAQYTAGTLRPIVQDHAHASRAPKLSKLDGRIDFNQPAVRVRQRIHGLTPWPGCHVRLGPHVVRLHRVQESAAPAIALAPGTITPDITIACQTGWLRVLELQPQGGKLMRFEDFLNGRPVNSGMICEPA